MSVERIDRAAPGDVALAGKALVRMVNAHCHTLVAPARPRRRSRLHGLARPRALPVLERLDRRGIALGAAFAFAEMLLAGVTTCVDFFYLQDEGNENAEAVIEAARKVGIRLVLARAMYDWDGAPEALPGDGGGRARRRRAS